MAKAAGCSAMEPASVADVAALLDSLGMATYKARKFDRGELAAATLPSGARVAQPNATSAGPPEPASVTVLLLGDQPMTETLEMDDEIMGPAGWEICVVPNLSVPPARRSASLPALQLSPVPQRRPGADARTCALPQDRCAAGHQAAPRAPGAHAEHEPPEQSSK